MKLSIFKSYFSLFVLILVLGGVFISNNQVQALNFTAPTIRDTDYKAKYSSQSVADPIVIEAGATREVIVRFKNAGTTTWNASGNRYISAYTVNNKYRKSQFNNNDWIDTTNPAKISKTTKPGEIAEIKIKLTAPNKVGNYREDFWLAAENYSWVDGGYFYLDIKVVAATTKPATTVKSEEIKETKEETSATSGVSAAIAMIRARKLSLNQGGEEVDFKVVLENDGQKTWQNISWQEAGSSENQDIRAISNIVDDSWYSATEIYQANKIVASKEMVDINFSFRAPVKKGNHIARFQLVVDGQVVSGSKFELPISVAMDAPADYIVPTFISSVKLISEPKIRVGLFKSDVPLKFRSTFDYDVYVGGTKKGVLTDNTLATVSYANGVYTFKSTDLEFTDTGIVRFVPSQLVSNYFEIVSYDRSVSWKSGDNFNKYRGILEYAYSPKSGMPYVINELMLDDYVAGIGETSNGAAMEYIKALLTAARSYAYYYISHAGEDDMFNVYPTTVDQLYLGYNSEVVMPRVAEAARATYGEMVFYGGVPVITPYFGNSDGQTKTWVEVWGGQDKPWIQSVVCKYDEGKGLWGHGVGMSAADAAARADKDGWDYQQLLKYYYTGVEVKKLY